MSVSKADAQATVIYDLGKRQVGGVDIVVALDHLQVRGDLAEELICIAIGQVTQAEDLADLAGGQEFAELARTGAISWVQGDYGYCRVTLSTLAGRS